MSHDGTPFKVGDRIKCGSVYLLDSLKGRFGTVTKIEGRLIWALIDDVANPTKDGWSFDPRHIELYEPEVTEEEIAELFGLTDDCPYCKGTGKSR